MCGTLMGARESHNTLKRLGQPRKNEEHGVESGLAFRQAVGGLSASRLPALRTQVQQTASGNIHQPVADRIHHQFRRLVDAERIHDVGPMYGHGVRAEVELVSDFLV